MDAEVVVAVAEDSWEMDAFGTGNRLDLGVGLAASLVGKEVLAEREALVGRVGRGVGSCQSWTAVGKGRLVVEGRLVAEDSSRTAVVEEGIRTAVEQGSCQELPGIGSEEAELLAGPILGLLLHKYADFDLALEELDEDSEDQSQVLEGSGLEGLGNSYPMPVLAAGTGFQEEPGVGFCQSRRSEDLAPQHLLVAFR